MFSCDEFTTPLEPVHGCLDSTADNYDSNATIDNNSCEYTESEDLDDTIEESDTIELSWAQLNDDICYFTNINDICENSDATFTQQIRFEKIHLLDLIIEENEYMVEVCNYIIPPIVDGLYSEFACLYDITGESVTGYHWYENNCYEWSYTASYGEEGCELRDADFVEYK